MNTPATLTRRDFLVSASAAAALLPLPTAGAPESSPSRWPIGCFNRPWVTWGYDAALDSIKAAGYEWTGLLSVSKTEPLTGSAATPEYLAALKQRIVARGLKANMTALRVRSRGSLEEAMADTRRQIANAQTLGLKYALTFGAGRPEEYAHYYKVMTDAAAFAQEKGIQVVLKPHGGGSGAAEEITLCLREVGHPNFKVWYDAGNVIFYTGKDPVAELERIARHVTGFCAKDCSGQRGEVMMQLGKGKVDFVRVFRCLKAAGFNGPIMLEGCAVGPTAQATMENARANREFLVRTLAAV